jgi:hypothetical protein
MLPLILVAVGAYLIGDSVLGDKKYAKGGKINLTPKYKVPKYKVGDRITHKWVGEGEIIKIIDEDNFNEGYVAQMDNQKKGDYYNIDEWDILHKENMAHGGKTQGYDDKEDERLAMEHGKMAKKDLDSTHARRDDARFEERGKMAKGGKIRSQKEFNELVAEKEKIVKNLSSKEISEMWNKNSNSPSKMTEDEAKTSTSKMYLRDLLVEKELTKAEHNKYFAKGGKLVGKQKNLDVNKNGKLDAEDFKMLRSKKMAKGGEVDDKISKVVKAIRKTRIDPDDVSPNFVNKIANEIGVSLSSKEVSDISDNFDEL